MRFKRTPDLYSYEGLSSKHVVPGRNKNGETSELPEISAGFAVLPTARILLDKRPLTLIFI
jgi:hypothetical protein